MKFSLSYLLSVVVVAASVGATPAYALTQNLVTFDPPTFSMGPSTYVAAGVAQHINTTPATFDGGVILGSATFFPAIVFASGTNVYGTADFGGHSLPNTLTIGINDPTNNITNQVSFALFNGETATQNYIVTTSFTDNTTATTQFNNIAPNWQSGYALVNLLFPSLQISKVSINVVNDPATSNTNSFNNQNGTIWDFLIDDVAFNQNIADIVPNVTPPLIQVPNQPVQVETLDPTVIENHGHGFCKGGVCDDKTTVRVFEVPDCKKCDHINFAVENMQAVPEPETYAMMMAGLGVMGFIARRRKVA